MTIPQEFISHRENVWRWLQTVMDDDQRGFIRLCADGDLVRPGEGAGLGWAALGMKLCNMLNLYDLAQPHFKACLVDRVKGFQQAEGESKGYFLDEAVLRQSERRFIFFRKPNMPVRRAETRQAYTALLGCGSQPDYPLPLPARAESEVRDYLKAQDWDNVPWGAGSHASHLAVFLAANAKAQGVDPMEYGLLKVWFEEMDSLLSTVTGGWHGKEGLPSSQVINGTMKVHTAYNFLGIAPPAVEKAIDYVLDKGVQEGGCNIVDGIYVLHTASRWSGHRLEEIRSFASGLVARIEGHRHVDGGMSYSMNGTQRGYYGTKASVGKTGIGDLHGTKLFTWAYVLIADICGWRDSLGWQIPLA